MVPHTLRSGPPRHRPSSTAAVCRPPSAAAAPPPPPRRALLTATVMDRCVLDSACHPPPDKTVFAVPAKARKQQPLARNDGGCVLSRLAQKVIAGDMDWMSWTDADGESFLGCSPAEAGFLAAATGYGNLVGCLSTAVSSVQRLCSVLCLSRRFHRVAVICRP